MRPRTALEGTSEALAELGERVAAIRAHDDVRTHGADDDSRERGPLRHALHTLRALALEPCEIAEARVEVAVDDGLQMRRILFLHAAVAVECRAAEQEDDEHAEQEILRIIEEIRRERAVVEEFLLFFGDSNTCDILPHVRDFLVEDREQHRIRFLRDGDGRAARKRDRAARDESGKSPGNRLVLRDLLPQKRNIGLVFLDGAQTFLGRPAAHELVRTIARDNQSVGETLAPIGDARPRGTSAPPRDLREIRRRERCRLHVTVLARPSGAPARIEQHISRAIREVGIRFFRRVHRHDLDVDAEVGADAVRDGAQAAREFPVFIEIGIRLLADDHSDAQRRMREQVVALAAVEQERCASAIGMVEIIQVSEHHRPRRREARGRLIQAVEELRIAFPHDEIDGVRIERSGGQQVFRQLRVKRAAVNLARIIGRKDVLSILEFLRRVGKALIVQHGAETRARILAADDADVERARAVRIVECRHAAAQVEHRRRKAHRDAPVVEERMTVWQIRDVRDGINLARRELREVVRPRIRDKDRLHARIVREQAHVVLILVAAAIDGRFQRRQCIDADAQRLPLFGHADTRIEKNDARENERRHLLIKLLHLHRDAPFP